MNFPNDRYGSSAKKTSFWIEYSSDKAESVNPNFAAEIPFKQDRMRQAASNGHHALSI